MANTPTAASAPQGARRAVPSQSPAPKKKKKGWVTALKWTLTAFLAAILVGLGGFTYLWVTTPIPDPNADFLTVNSHLYFADGKKELGTLSIQNRDPVAYSEIPKTMTDAMVAAENPTFWTDPGISLPAIMRAITTLGSDNVQGGSTITQQYVKILYLSQEKTLTRKLKEMIISLKLGQEQSKEQILEGYLNTVYFGRGAYGVEAAAQAYFNKSITKVNLEESIVLASLVNAPGLLDPALGDKQAADLLERYQFVINQMVDMGTMTAAQKADIYDALPKFPEYKRDSRFGGTNGYLLQMAMAELRELGFDEAKINGGGLNVTTTFDAEKQAEAVKTMQAKVKEVAAIRGKKTSQLHGSLVSVDNATGGLVALYAGGDDYVKQNRNWALETRPAGSTFKTWELVAALRQGYSLDTRLKGYTFTAADGKTISGHSSGMVTLQNATTHSNNAAFVDLATQMNAGGASTVQAANDAGIPGTVGEDGWVEDLRVGMGASEVSPADAASGYSTLANDGAHFPWYVISKVTDSTGEVLYEAKPKADQGIEKDVATEATEALTEVATSGTGAVVSQLGYPVAGKTGTRDEPTSSGGTKTTAAWFVGYTKQYTTAVNFVAGQGGTDDLNGYTWGSFVGGGPPAQAWLSYMTTAMSGLPSEQFTESTYTPTTSASAPSTSSSSNSKPKSTKTKSTHKPSSPDPTNESPPEPTNDTSTSTTTSTTTTTSKAPHPTDGP